MKILYAGTPALSVPCLAALVMAGHQVAVLTNPDTRQGRSSQTLPSEVKKSARLLGLEVFDPEKLDLNFRELIHGQFDLLVSFAFGRIFGPKFLKEFPLGGLNVHPSLLPRWRGPSPLTAVILALDINTGICVQTLASGMDEGQIVARLERELDGTETTASLTEWAALAAVPLLVSAVSALENGALNYEAQTAPPTYCSLIKKEDGHLNWSASARILDAQVRAFDPWPGAFTTWKGQTLTIKKSIPVPMTEIEALKLPTGGPVGQVVALDKSKGILVQTGEGYLALRELQLAGKKSLDYRSFVNGAQDFVGSRLGENA